MTSRPDSPRDLSGLSLPAAFVFAVAAFAWWRFSGNTADNDLWGHVLYGQRMLALGHLEKIDPFSWTAAGAPWLNHEVLAELTLGWVHRLAGGTGLWLLAMIAAIITVALALLTGRHPAREPGLGLVQAALLAASTNGIALGFSARPQLFTMFALVLLLAQLQAIDRGRRWPLVTLPLLTVVWINTHGGILLALVLLFLAAAVTLLCQAFPSFPVRGFFPTPERNAWRRFNTAFLLCGAASLVTPWGMQSVIWLFESIQYTRPEITEWRPTPFDPAHAAFWFVAFLSLTAWLVTRCERRPWAAASLALLLVIAWRHQRHIPLFCLANLVLTPPHLLDLLERLKPRVSSLIAAFHTAGVRLAAALLLLAGGGAALVASVGSPKQHPWTIEVERDQFPCAALHFLQEHPIEGNLLVFFDWGQQAMWALPHNPVSFDGRLDTIYPRAVIEAHWRFYRGESFDPAALDLRRADVALLPTGSGGVMTLLKTGWTLAYWDPLACVVVRTPAQHPSLAGLVFPVRAGQTAVQGREPFPNQPSARVLEATAQ